MPFSTVLPGRDPGMVHARCAMPPDCRTESLRAWKAEKPVFMSTVLYLPTSTKAETETPLQEPEAKGTGNCGSETARIAHDLKNCMCIVIGHHKSQRQYGSGTYLTASQASVGRCSRGDDSSGRRDDSGGRAAGR